MRTREEGSGWRTHHTSMWVVRCTEQGHIHSPCWALGACHPWPGPSERVLRSRFTGQAGGSLQGRGVPGNTDPLLLGSLDPVWLLQSICPLVSRVNSYQALPTLQLMSCQASTAPVRKTRLSSSNAHSPHLPPDLSRCVLLCLAPSSPLSLDYLLLTTRAPG